VNKANHVVIAIESSG